MVINKTTLTRSPNVGQFVAADGRIVAGDILSLDVAQRVAMGWYVLREGYGGADGYEWDETTGECVQTFSSLADVKSEAIQANRDECQRRIEARWTAFAQLDIALGVYADPAMMADCQEWIASHIDAENAAADQINAAETAETVNAVIVEWPHETTDAQL